MSTTSDGRGRDEEGVWPCLRLIRCRRERERGAALKPITLSVRRVHECRAPRQDRPESGGARGGKVRQRLVHRDLQSAARHQVGLAEQSRGAGDGAEGSRACGAHWR